MPDIPADLTRFAARTFIWGFLLPDVLLRVTRVTASWPTINRSPWPAAVGDRLGRRRCRRACLA